MIRRKQAVSTWHLVKFCPPSKCTGGRAVAVVDYRLACGHLVRLRHFGSLAYRAAKGQVVYPTGGWVCPACARLEGCACPT